MTTPHVLSIQIGATVPLFIREDGADMPVSVLSGIRKHAVSTVENAQAIQLKRIGLAGDEQADLTVHGGIDKAVYAYPSEHYNFWREALSQFAPQSPLLNQGLPWGSMGENLTLSGLREEALWLGDTLLIGDCALVVASPRQPCFKFNAVMGWKGAAKAMLQQGCSGWYLRVAQVGSMYAGQAVEVIPGARQTPLLAQQRHQAKLSPLR